MNRIGLNEHFTFRKLLRFTAPSIVMAIFTSVYTIVDGLFVSNVVGDAAFTGLNLIYPVIMVLGAIGMMFGAGGSALIAKTLGVALTALAEGLSSPLAHLFVRDAETYLLTRDGLRIYSVAYLIMGFGAFGSAFFTALSNGLVSALISFSRTLLFQVGAILVLPLLWGITGVWVSVIAAELLSCFVTAFFFLFMRKRYGY